jgi:hypothetical protein
MLNPDAPAIMTSRFEPRDTAASFSALDRLAKTSDTYILGGSIEVNGGRRAGDYLTLRLGQDVKISAADVDAIVKTLVEKLNATEPTVKLRLDGLAFPSGRDLTAFCDVAGEDFDRVTWTQG